MRRVFSTLAKKPYYSVFDLFKIGVGPSSSHTNAPMIAAGVFVDNLRKTLLARQTARIKVDLFGSLALTGRGHGTMRAIAQGLLGFRPETVPTCANFLEEQDGQVALMLSDAQETSFSMTGDIQAHRKFLPGKHPNFMRFYALDAVGSLLSSQEFSSIGGGELQMGPLESDMLTSTEADKSACTQGSDPVLPFPFTTGAELLAHCNQTGMRIPQIMLENERALCGGDLDAISQRLIAIVGCMFDSIQRGCLSQQELLPGPLNLPRKAAKMFSDIEKCDEIEKVSVYALAVSEENAAGGRVVTSPTNGSAGVIPAVLFHHCAHNPSGALEFLLTAGAIGAIFKHGASISAAQVGCQGEIGVSSSMAAGALTGLLDLTNNPKKILNAAEIAMEHHLGITCDPVLGLVQVPCIERNAMGAIKAITASKLAMLGNGQHVVSLDACVKTMYQTGLHMDPKFKETSLAGLAVHFQERGDATASDVAC